MEALATTLEASFFCSKLISAEWLLDEGKLDGFFSMKRGRWMSGIHASGNLVHRGANVPTDSGEVRSDCVKVAGQGPSGPRRRHDAEHTPHPCDESLERGFHGAVTTPIPSLRATTFRPSIGAVAAFANRHRGAP